MDEEKKDDEQQPWTLGRRASPRDLRRTFWPGVKHDPDDTQDKDWANSEPDPNAP